MIPILFEENTTDFSSNGIGRLSDCISCTVEEQESGIYECKFQYPMTGVHYSDIQENKIIYCIHDDTKTEQPFEIYGRTAPHNGVVTFYAHHISYKLGNVILNPFTATSCAEALIGLKENEINESDFTFWTDKSSIGDFEIKVPTATRAILAGVQGSILDVFGGGDYEWDGYTVKLWNDRGVDNNVYIRYGVNLVKLTQETDNSNSFNAVVPYWVYEGTGEEDPDILITIPEKIIRASSATSQTLRPVPLDLSSEWESPPTIQQLIERSEAYMNSNRVWKLDENITVDFVALWQTEDYKDVAPLQRVRLYDYVHVAHDELGINKRVQVVRVKYNVLTEKYDEIELGEAKQSFAQVISAITEANIKKDVPTKSFVQQAIETTTSLITGGMGGHVVFHYDANGKPTEMLVMDTEDESTAVNVLRINVNGIGFSSHGTEGPFNTAWTLDGHFVANYIDTGTLSGNVIKAGIIADVANKNYWNLETGEFSLQVVEGDSIDTAIKNAASSVAGYTLETPFTWSNNGQTANFTAIVYKGSEDITSTLDPSWFVWTLRTEDSETQVGTGKTLSLNKSQFGYGATVTCTFTTYDATPALRSPSGAKLKSVNNKQMLMYAQSDADIIVSDLPVKTAAQIDPTDTIMGIDNVEGYQVSVTNFADYILKTVKNTINGSSQTIVQALTSLKSDISANASAIASNLASIQANATAIANNLAAIQTNATAIAENAAAIAANTSAINTKVNRSGDTMTGNLLVQKNSPLIRQISSNIDSTIGQSIPSNTTAVGSWHIFDNQNYQCGYSDVMKTNADDLYMSFVLRRKNASGTVISNGFYQHIDATGAGSITFAGVGKTAWQNALGITDLFVKKTYQYTIASIAANGDADVTPAQFGFSTPSGYSVVCFYYISSGNNMAIRAINPTQSTSTSWCLALRNMGSTAITNRLITVGVLYVRSIAV